MNKKPTYQELSANVVKAREVLNSIEDTNSLEFENASEAYKAAKQKRDSFSYNMKHLTPNGHLVRT
jgi:hypothetical protein